MRSSQRRALTLVASVAAAALAGAGLGACGGTSSTPQKTLNALTAAWDRGDWTGVSELVYRPASDFAKAQAAIVAGLGAARATHTAGAVAKHGSMASAPIASSYELPGVGAWEVTSRVSLVEHSGHWLVSWSPSVIAPSLRPGERLTFTRTWAPRAPILGAGGVALTTDQPVVSVGLQGSRVHDPAAVSAALVSAGATAQQASSALTAAAAHPSFFEPVLQMSEARYQQLGGQQSAVYKIAGTVFRDVQQRAAVTPGLAAHLVGSVGPATAEELHQLGPSYTPASVVGQNGLEAAYEKQLAGTPGGTVDVVSAAGKTVTTLARFAPRPGTPVQTGIEPAVQTAAESALAGVAQHAALVAVRASTGQVIASVSDPASDQFDQALDGAFPPGSTFKVITATSLIEAGLSPQSPASCPPAITVDGEVFHNAEGEKPAPTMLAAFAESCNTAFVGLATAHLQPSSLPAAAVQYGIGSPVHIGLAAFAGDVPTPSDAAGLAQTAIGQAKVLVSPLDLAMVAADIDSGTVRPPQLVADAGIGAGGAGVGSGSGQALPAPVVSGLRQMLAQVVATGTAAGTGLPAGTFAKTGTAQYGSGNPLPTDAWLMGYRGDVAFAMVVQNAGGNGGPTDGPVVARFLDALPAGS
ncbi:MAG: penicillin-binding transpeptidase domain-containing protein [Acidimicrobiales bacterium]